MRKFMSRALVALFAAAPFGVTAAAAQSHENAAADAAIACLDIENTERRLDCLEAAARELRATRVVIEQENDVGAPAADEEGSLEDQFGAESLDTTKREKRKEQQSFRLEAKVVEIRVDPYKTLTVTLENGQVWRQLSSDTTKLPITGDDRLYTVTIKRGPLNNYRMQLDKFKRWIRVRRIK